MCIYTKFPKHLQAVQGPSEAQSWSYVGNLRSGSGEEQHFISHSLYIRGLGLGTEGGLLSQFSLSPLLKEICGRLNHGFTLNLFCFTFTFKLYSIRNYTKAIPLVGDDKQHTFPNTNTQPIKKTSVRWKLSGSHGIFSPVTDTLLVTHSQMQMPVRCD